MIMGDRAYARNGWKADIPIDVRGNLVEAVTVQRDDNTSINTFALAVIAGSLSGAALMLVVGAWGQTLPTNELWAIPLVILAVGTIGSLFVAAGLALFGLPLTALLRRWWDKPWIGLVAVISGAATGNLAWYAIDHSLFFGQIHSVVVNPGALWGVPTAVAWWLLKRREISRR
jgi:hypothetical protein